MKTLGKIKLNQFSKEELDQRKLNALRGGDTCSCSCSCACSCTCNPYFTDTFTNSSTSSLGDGDKCIHRDGAFLKNNPEGCY